MLAVVISLVSSVNRENLRDLYVSTITDQPIPPKRIKIVIVIRITILLLIPSKLLESGSIVNPALLNPDTDRKADCQTDSDGDRHQYLSAEEDN